jgi:hypothetical protein
MAAALLGTLSLSATALASGAPTGRSAKGSKVFSHHFAADKYGHGGFSVRLVVPSSTTIKLVPQTPRAQGQFQITEGKVSVSGRLCPSFDQVHGDQTGRAAILNEADNASGSQTGHWLNKTSYVLPDYLGSGRLSEYMFALHGGGCVTFLGFSNEANQLTQLAKSASGSLDHAV